MESIVSSTPSATKQTAKGKTRPHLRHLRLNVRGISVHGLAAGTCGPQLVILHGGGLDAAGFSFKNTIPYSKLEIIPACGHLPPVERPDSFNRFLCSFLENKRQPVLDRIQEAFFRTRQPDQRPGLCNGLRKRQMRFCGGDNVFNRKRAN